MTRSTSLLTLALGALLGAGCGAPAGPGGPAGPATVSYRQDASVLLERYCTSCHTEGGIAPFSLTGYQAASAHAQAIKAAVQSGAMPPWMPSDKGVPLRYSRAMRPQDKDLLVAWVDAGAPEGDEGQRPRTDIPPAETAAPPRRDLVLDPGVMYQPNSKLSDDYRCFITDPGLKEDGFFTAGVINPGNPAIVHHVIVYEVTAKDAEQVRQADAREAGPGYTCFGGPGGGASQTVLVWAPGSVPTRAPEGLAIRVSKGSLLVIQVHYNLVNFRGVGDQTTAVLERSPARPGKIAVLLPVMEPNKLFLKAGDANARQVIRIPMLGVLAYLKLTSLTAYGNVPHMHTLGKRIETRLAGGDALVEIPRWDFHWQQQYQFREPVVLRPQDTLEVECNYDNSAANQPVIDGQRQAPRDVTWGEKTTDEMCLSYMQVGLDPAIPL